MASKNYLECTDRLIIISLGSILYKLSVDYKPQGPEHKPGTESRDG